MLVFKEMRDQELHENSHSNDESKSGTFISKHITEMKSTVSNISPLATINPGLTKEGDNEQRRVISRINGPKFFQRLTVGRKIDVCAFVLYHLAYVTFNFIYWLQI